MTMTDEPTVDEQTGEVRNATPGPAYDVTPPEPPPDRLGLTFDPPPPPDRIKTYRLESPDINQIVPALIKARTAFGPLIKDARNDHLRSSYASLANVLASTAEALEANGLLLLQQNDFDAEGKPTLTTRLLHVSGQWFAEFYPLAAPRATGKVDDAKDIGAANTYARRNAALTLLGIAAEDPDAQFSGRNRGQQQEGGVYQPPEPSEDEAAASVVAFTEFSAKIAAATDGPSLTRAGQELAADHRLRREQRSELRDAYTARARELIAEAEAKKRADGKITVTRVADRPRPVPDGAGRTKARQQAHEAHRSGLRGAALAVGLLLDSPEDEQYITRQEFEQMLLVTPEQAAEAELDRSAEEAGA